MGVSAANGLLNQLSVCVCVSIFIVVFLHTLFLPYIPYSLSPSFPSLSYTFSYYYVLFPFHTLLSHPLSPLLSPSFLFLHFLHLPLSLHPFPLFLPYRVSLSRSHHDGVSSQPDPRPRTSQRSTISHSRVLSKSLRRAWSSESL